jgi:hypothetical protein
MDWGEQADSLAEDRGPTFTANYPGRCAGCGERFEEGDSVFYSDGEVHGEDCCGYGEG